MKKERKRKAQGNVRVQLKTENMIKVFMNIAKEPLSFSELLQKTSLSRPALTDHLKFLESHDVNAIYRDTIKATETRNPKEIGKVVYRPTVDEIPRILEQVLSLNLLSLTEPLEDNEPEWKLSEDKRELDRKLLEHKQAIVKALSDYINQFKINREQALKLDIESLKRESQKKRES